MQPDRRDQGEGSDTRGSRRKKRRQKEGPLWAPEWKGKLFRLMNLRYVSQRDRVTGERTYSADVVLRGPNDHVEYTGKASGCKGTITAFDHALRSALERWPKEFTLPPITLRSYRIGLCKPELGTESPAYAKARIRFNGREYKKRVVHVDGETAMCLLLLAMYDRFCYERWRELLQPSGITPEEAIANLGGSVVRGNA